MTDILAALDADPAAGILAAADHVERLLDDFDAATDSESPDAAHNPDVWELRSRVRVLSAGARAAVRRWRVTVDWWQSIGIGEVHGLETTPCRDCALWQATVAEVRAYVSGAA